jgi:RNA polymerase sigma-70 factor (sigma-E family)
VSIEQAFATHVRWGRLSIDDDFASYYNARAEHMRTTAYLLCGDWHLAQDLVQLTFTKLYRVWRRIERHQTLDQYARRVLLRAFLDERRRPWRREVPTEVIDPPLPAAPVGSPDDRIVLKAALGHLPPRQRAVIVLRFWADLPVDEVAAVLGCSIGTVKSQTSDGLANLRRALGSVAKDIGHRQQQTWGGSL